MEASFRDRLLSGLGAAIVVTLFGYALLLGLTVGTRFRIEQPLTLLELEPPQPEQPRIKPPVVPPKSSRVPGRASPRNLRTKAAEIVAPPPAMPLPAVPLIVSAAKADVGAAPSSGASDLPGPGQGGGGEGNGPGSGGDGDGPGDGGVPPRQIHGRLKISDLPRNIVESGIGGTVGVHYRVNVDGSVSDCMIMQSSGSAELDQLTCQLIEQRFRFDPSRDDDGRRVRSAIEQRHSWIIDRAAQTPPRP